MYLYTFCRLRFVVIRFVFLSVLILVYVMSLYAFCRLCFVVIRSVTESRHVHAYLPMSMLVL
jgi:hypothetical protein